MVGITTARIQLGKRLQEARRRAGVRPDAVISAIRCSDAHLSHIETGRNPPTNLDQLNRLAELYNLTTSQLTDLVILYRTAAEVGWWSKIHGGIPDWLVRYLGLESDARRVRAFEGLNIHGLLQTPGYLQAKCGLIPELSAREIMKRAQIRQKRQVRLTSEPDPLELVAVICESALQLCVHAGEVGLDQLEFLAQRATLPNVELLILPTSTGLVPDGPITLLDFPDHVLPPMAYTETPVGGDTITNPKVVTRLATLFDHLRGHALSRAQSGYRIAELIETHPRSGNR